MLNRNAVWARKNVQRIVDNVRRWRLENPEKGREYHLRRAYGETPASIEKRRKQQKNRCALCGERFSKIRRIHIDHDHQTDRVRSLLHVTCNLRLGTVEDKQFMRQARKYLRRYR